MTKPNEVKPKLITDGTGIFVSVLGNVAAGIGEERH
jgi:hypothetical protein